MKREELAGLFVEVARMPASISCTAFSFLRQLPTATGAMALIMLAASVGLAAEPPAAARDDGAPLYLEAFVNLPEYFETRSRAEDSLPLVGEGRLPALGKAMADDQRQAIAMYLEVNAKSLALLHGAGALKECRWPDKYKEASKNKDTLPLVEPILAGARQGARLLELEAIVQAEKGEGEFAARAVQDSLVMAKRLEDIDPPMGIMVRDGCEQAAAGTLERVLNRVQISEADLATLAQYVAAADLSVALPASEFDNDPHLKGRGTGLWHTWLRNAQAAIAVERFRAAEGKLPAGLGALVPRFLSAVPTDPFDGQPLRYRQTEGGYVVYSVGPNKIDQGGRWDKPTGWVGETGNLPFRVEREATHK